MYANTLVHCDLSRPYRPPRGSKSTRLRSMRSASHLDVTGPYPSSELGHLPRPAKGTHLQALVTAEPSRQERWYAATFATPSFVQHDTVFKDTLRMSAVEDFLKRPEVVHIALGCVQATKRATDYIVCALASTLARWRRLFFSVDTYM